MFKKLFQLGKRSFDTCKCFAVFFKLGAFAVNNGGGSFCHKTGVGKLAGETCDLAGNALLLALKACALAGSVDKLGKRQVDGGRVGNDLRGIVGADDAGKAFGNIDLRGANSIWRGRYSVSVN